MSLGLYSYWEVGKGNVRKMPCLGWPLIALIVLGTSNASVQGATRELRTSELQMGDR